MVDEGWWLNSFGGQPVYLVDGRCMVGAPLLAVSRLWLVVFVDQRYPLVVVPSPTDDGWGRMVDGGPKLIDERNRAFEDGQAMVEGPVSEVEDQVQPYSLESSFVACPQLQSLPKIDLNLFLMI